MGGYGSGRWSWHTKKHTVEDGLKLPVGTLKETFNRGTPWRGSVHWTRGTKRTDSIGYEFRPHDEAGRLRLFYTTTRPSGKVDFDYWLELVTTPCNFGGRRWWFLCPLVVGGKPCRRRCGKLYLPPGGRYFGCRECHDLTYTSCQESHKYDSLFASMAAGTPYTAKQMERALKRRRP